jgi:hypothetical protein
MNSHKQTGRITGILLLIIFALGVTVFQVLQGPTLFADDFLTSTSLHSDEIILSVLLMFLSGAIDIIIAIIILPIINRQNQRLGFLYLAFCIVSFIVMSVDNISVLSMLEVSKEYMNGKTADLAFLKTMGTVAFQNHWWTHHLSLLVSCLPAFVLFYTMYFTRLVPRAISLFGILAVALMFAEMLLTLFGKGLGMNMLLPIALAQLIFPIWLLIKGFSESVTSISD